MQHAFFATLIQATFGLLVLLPFAPVETLRLSPRRFLITVLYGTAGAAAVGFAIGDVVGALRTVLALVLAFGVVSPVVLMFRAGG